jgi:hypothetical protein
MSDTALFIRLLRERDKGSRLETAAESYRSGQSDTRIYKVAPERFQHVPGAPFAYWVSDAVRKAFIKLPPLNQFALATSGTGTLDDFRFLRLWTECAGSEDYYPFAKGGAYSPIYFDQHLMGQWKDDGAEMKAWIIYRYGGGHWARNIRSTEHYFRPGLTWPRRTQSGLGMRVMPAGCIFADKGPAAFVEDNDPDELLALLAVTTSAAFCQLVDVQMAFGSYEVGVIQRTPVPDFEKIRRNRLSTLVRRIWSLRRTLDTIIENSHAFLLPAALRSRLSEYYPEIILAEIANLQTGIDEIVCGYYGFTDANNAKTNEAFIRAEEYEDARHEHDDDNAEESAADSQSSLLSWCVGVAFRRFDWRLATGERQPPPEPEPFDPLPAKSPGMLPDDAEPFHLNGGILVDDPGHPHDLLHLIESVLERVEVPVPPGIRRWLQRDFFPEHLKQYSKSRRKAPIYWPLSTTSGGYTLWIYYPSLTGETLYSMVNDFVEPKLKSVVQTAQSLRGKPSRNQGEEKELEQAQDLELELTEMRDTLLEIAKGYKPNHDDGVQITAAPLWPLFRHKPWQKVLKDTWKKLEKGHYDWAHLAMSYWPDRVREKCRTDKSLAIAHGLEDVFEGNT